MDHNIAIETKAAERYLLGEMSDAQTADFEEHFFICPACAEAVRTVAYFVDNAQRLESEQLNPKTAARVVPIGRRDPAMEKKSRWMQPLWARVAGIAAAVLVAVVGYQNLVEIPALRSGALLVMAPTTLRGTVRGAASAGGTHIVIHPGEVYVPLDMDLNPNQPFPYYRAELETTSGETLMKAVGEAPPHGTLEVQLPVGRLSPGSYLLLVRGETGASSQTGPEVERFPLEISR